VSQAISPRTPQDGVGRDMPPVLDDEEAAMSWRRAGCWGSKGQDDGDGNGRGWRHRQWTHPRPRPSRRSSSLSISASETLAPGGTRLAISQASGQLGSKRQTGPSFSRMRSMRSASDGSPGGRAMAGERSREPVLSIHRFLETAPARSVEPHHVFRVTVELTSAPGIEHCRALGLDSWDPLRTLHD